MTNQEKINELLKASQNGTITAEQVTAAGLHRSILQELVKQGMTGYLKRKTILT